MDRRKRKSQVSIMSAFLKLLEKKSFDEISVSEIIELADISRGTFYANYEDKFDLLDKFTLYYIEKLFVVCYDVQETDENYFKVIFYNMFEFLEENHSIYNILFSKPSTVTFREIFQNKLTQQFESSYTGKNDYGIEFSFLSAGVVGLLKYWVENINKTTISLATEKLWGLLKNVPFFNDLTPE